MNIEKKVNQWQKAGLLSVAQGQSIIAYENNESKPYLLYALSTLAVFFIGLGVISLIAVNWDQINSVIKLSVSFSLLAVCAGLTWRAYARGNDKVFDWLLFLFSLLLMGEIGLIGQIYQLQSDGSVPFMFWSAIVLPLTFFCRRPILPALWLSIAIVSSFVFLIENFREFEIFFKMIFKNWLLGLALFAPISLAIIYQLMKSFTGKMFSGLRPAFKFWAIVTIIITTLFFDFNGRYFCLLGSNEELKFSLMFGIKNVKTTISIMLGLYVALIAISYILGYKLKNWTFPVILSLLLIGSILPLGFVLSLAVLAIVGYGAYKTRNIRLLNLYAFLVGLRVFILYCDVAMNLAPGIGMLSSGIILLILIRSWPKIKNYIKRKVNHEN